MHIFDYTFLKDDLLPAQLARGTRTGTMVIFR